MNDRTAEITAKVIELAAQQGGVDPATVAPQTHFINDLHYDSLDLVEFTMSLEDEFEVSVPDNDAADLDTVAKVVGYVVGRAGAVVKPTEATA